MCCLRHSWIHETAAEVTATLPLPQIQGEALALPHHTGAACTSVGTPGLGLGTSSASDLLSPGCPPSLRAQPRQEGPDSAAGGPGALSSPTRPSQTQRCSVSQATAKGGSDNCFMENSTRPAKAVTKPLFKIPPWAPSTEITGYQR